MTASVLVLRALGLGDLLTAAPALRAVRRAWPQDRIVLGCPSNLEPLARLLGAVDEVLPARGLDKQVRFTGPPPEVAVNLHGRGPRSHRLLAATQPGCLLAFACAPAAHRCGPAWDDGDHEVTRWCRLLDWYGVPADPAELMLAPPAQPPPVRRAIVVHPGAAYESRRWPPERYAHVARTLEAVAPPVVVTGSAAERPRAARVAALAGLPPERVLAGRTSLASLAALVADARLVVCGDTGVGHLATAYGTASVLLFGPVSPAQWGPPPERSRHRVLWRGRTGDPWGSAPDPGLLAIGPGQVLDAAERLLDGSPDGSPDGLPGASERVAAARATASAQ